MELSLFPHDITSFVFNPKTKWFGAESFEWLNQDYDFSDEKGLIARLCMKNANGDQMNFILKVIPYERSSKPIYKMSNYVEIKCLELLAKTNSPFLPIHSMIGKCRVFDSGLCGFPMLKFHGEIMETCSYIITPEYSFSLRSYFKTPELHASHDLDIEKIYLMILWGIKTYQDQFSLNMNDLHLDNILIHKLPYAQTISFGEFSIETEYIPIIWDFELSNSPTIKNTIGDIGLGNIPTGQFVPEYDIHLCSRELFWHLDRDHPVSELINDLFFEDTIYPNPDKTKCETKSQCTCYEHPGFIAEGTNRPAYMKMIKELEEMQYAECKNPLNPYVIDERMVIEDIIHLRDKDNRLPIADDILNNVLFEKFRKNI